MTGKQNSLLLMAVPCDVEGDRPAVEQPRRRGREEGSSAAIKTEGASMPRYRGLLLRRRCDSCGARIGVYCEGGDRVIMRCPGCLREYVFFQRS